MEKIILATSSERRIELFRKVCKNFEVVKSSFKEDEIFEEDPVKFAIKQAIGKTKEVGERYPDWIVVGGDTVVFLNGEIIGKPKDYFEAKNILSKLSGTLHSVITGISIYRKKDEKLLYDYEISYVKFKKLKEEEIEEYLKEGDYLDKAGAYGIQNINDRFVEEIFGDFENIVGFPTGKLKELLKKFLAEEVSLEIEDIALPATWGVSRYKNLVIFVPQGLTGDKVKVRLIKKKKDFSFAEIIEIEKFSPFRVNPLCEHFGICGGCSFQNLLYEKQLELKKNWLIQCLVKFAGVKEEIKIEEIYPSPSIYFYRNKMEFAFGLEKGKIVLGLRERNLPYNKTYRKKVIPLKECPIFSKNLPKIFQPVLEFVNSTPFLPYDPFTKRGFFRHLVIKESKATNHFMIILSTKTSSDFKSEEFVDTLKSIEEVKSIYHLENEHISDIVSYEKKSLLYGSPYIEEKLKDFRFRIYPDTFFQPNTEAAEILYNKILENIEGKNNRILGLYSGAGCIEIFICSKAEEVIGIDCENANIGNAKENSEINNIKNCKFWCEKVEKALDALKKRKFTHLIIDPPRGGMTNKAIKKIIKLNIPNILYISCNPSTLSRDIKFFKETGYSISKIYCFDFFPHTAHLETLTILKKTC